MLRTPWLLLRALLGTWLARRRQGPLRPSWPFRFEWIIAFMRLDWTTLWKKPPEFIRRYNERLALWPGDVKDVRRSPADVGGIPATWFDPPTAVPGPVLLYLHGGSYQFGSSRTHGPLIARLARSGSLRALGLDYRLAPEHPRPAQLEDALTAYRWLLAQGTRPEQIAVAGDSAGGHLALALCAALPAHQLPLPGACVLFSPWLDLSSSRPSFTTNARYDYGTREMLLAQARTFAGELPLEDPRVSPLAAPIPKLPPTLLVVGSAEVLLDECREYATRAVAAAQPLTLDLLPDLPHNGVLFPQEHPSARAGLERAGIFLRTHTAGR